MVHKSFSVFLALLFSLASNAAFAWPPANKQPLPGLDMSRMRFENGAYRQELDDGTRAVFTFDPALQRYANGIFTKYQVPAGAAVILNSRTGRVLALAQRRIKPDLAELRAVALDPAPPAASLFKIVTAAALLEEKKATVNTKICYHGGSQKLHTQHLTDNPKKDTACATLTSALGRSINAIFAKLSDRKLERQTLLAYAERFGFNQEIPFDLPVASSKADIPSDRLARARTAAGFWHTHLSPLHAAMIMQSLAQDGSMLQPYVVDRVEGPAGELLYKAEPRYLGRTVSAETARSLVKAMVYTTRRGTARKAFHDKKGLPFLPGIQVSGKTGTLTGRKPYRGYTWFVGTAPADKPEVVCAVLVVNEPKWRIKASGVAMQLLKKYFELTKKRKKNPAKTD